MKPGYSAAKSAKLQRAIDKARRAYDSIWQAEKDFDKVMATLHDDDIVVIDGNEIYADELGSLRSHCV